MVKSCYLKQQRQNKAYCLLNQTLIKQILEKEQDKAHMNKEIVLLINERNEKWMYNV